jgi:hypothetical protein
MLCKACVKEIVDFEYCRHCNEEEGTNHGNELTFGQT